MRRTSFSDMNCSIARSLEQIGEWWTLLIIREAFFGTRRFGAFQANLGIAPNVLTQRLQDLVAHGILEITASSENGRALDYGLTDKGRDLFPIIVALTQWGDRHAAPAAGPPVRIVERRSGEEVAPVTLRSSRSGRALGLHEVTVAPGPGATSQQLAYFERLRQRQAEKAAAREAAARGAASAGSD